MYYLTEEGKKYILRSTQKTAKQKAERLKKLLRSMQPEKPEAERPKKPKTKGHGHPIMSDPLASFPKRILQPPKKG